MVFLRRGEKKREKAIKGEKKRYLIEFSNDSEI